MTPIDKPYKPVPTTTAKAIAEEFDKSMVIILAWDPVYGHIHTTTYGVDPQNKAWAVQGGEIATKALGGLVEAATHFEDYRLTQARKLLAALKDLLKLPATVEERAARELRALAAITEAERFLGNTQETTA